MITNNALAITVTGEASQYSMGFKCSNFGGDIRIMGKIEIDHTGSGSGITLSSDGTSLLLDGSAIGGGGGSPDLFAESYDGSSTKPSASGSQNAVAIGQGAQAITIQ